MPALGAQDLDLLMARRQRGRDLHDARVEAAGEIVDLAQRLDLDRESRVGDRIEVAVKPGVGGARRLGQGAATVADGKTRRFGRAANRLVADLGRMRVAGCFPPYGPQPEALGRVEGRRLQPPVVERQHLGTATLQEKLAIVGPGDASRTVCSVRPTSSRVSKGRKGVSDMTSILAVGVMGEGC